ncbi:alpha/beta fold hydrolase [Pontibacter cellulosilyticus]|nr:alpha/beta hydrolase [Pontibacter cellulosilyticus]
MIHMELLIGNKDTRLYTYTYPNPGKETILMLHGGPGVPDGLSPVAEYLSQYFQVIMFHQRGTLSSPCYSSNYTISRYISDIDAIASHFELEEFHIFGHSWGGLYAQLYADQSLYRLLSLFLCSPASGTGKQWREMSLEVAAYNKRKCTKSEWLDMMKNAVLGFLGSDASYEKFFTQFCLNCNKGYQVEDPVPVMVDHIYARPINRTNLALLFYPKLEVYAPPEMNITVTYGDDDIYGESINYTKERLPSAKFSTVPGTSHFPWLQNPEAFYKVLAGHYGIDGKEREAEKAG